MADPITKRQLIDALMKTRDEALATLRGVPAATFDEGRYENGWNGREILAHIASIEWTYPRLLDLAKQLPGNGEQSADSKQQSASAAPVRRTADDGSATNAPAPGILSYNDRQVEKRDSVPVANLIAEFEKNRAATIAAVEAVDDALFVVTIRSAGGITGPLAGVMRAVAVDHVRMHLADILGEHRGGVRFQETKGRQ